MGDEGGGKGRGMTSQEKGWKGGWRHREGREGRMTSQGEGDDVTGKGLEGGNDVTGEGAGGGMTSQGEWDDV